MWAFYLYFCFVGAASGMHYIDNEHLIDKFIFISSLYMTKVIGDETPGKMFVADEFLEVNISEERTEFEDRWLSKDGQRVDFNPEEIRAINNTTMSQNQKGAGGGIQGSSNQSKNFEKEFNENIPSVTESPAVTDIDTIFDMSFYRNSKIFNIILENLPNMLNRYSIESRSCKNKCGTSYECSCKPICLHLKTCCVDFLDVCSDFYDFIQLNKKHKWLETVETQCVSGSLVVDSCSQNSNFIRDNYETQLYSANVSSYFNPLNNLSEIDEAYKSFSAADKLSLIDVLFLLSQKPKLDVYQNNLQQMINSVPISDTSTGISYRNISMYICNNANLSQGVLWNVFFKIDGDFVLPASKLRNVHEFFNNIKINFPWYSNSLRSNVEHCSNDKLINSCPKDFKDLYLEKACNNVNYMVKVKLSRQNITIDQLFKNPFCLYCNSGIEETVKQLSVHRYSALGKNHLDYELRLLFNSFTDSNQGITVHNFRPDYFNLRARWEYLSCQFLIQGNKNTGLTASNNIMGFPRIKSECRIGKCDYFSFNQHSCMEKYRYIIALPPAEYALSQDYLEIIYTSWRDLVILNVPFTSNETIPEETRIRVYQEPIVVNELLFQYVLSLKLNHELAGSWMIRKMMSKPLQEMLSRLDFPFEENHIYVCHLVGANINNEVLNFHPNESKAMYCGKGSGNFEFCRERDEIL